ncbi:MAG: universal stress protein [Salinarimonas sp.]|nr:universal stress protein [Salinarimonas sp.]
MDILIQVSPVDAAHARRAGTDFEALSPHAAFALDLAASLSGRVTALVFEVTDLAGEEEDEVEMVREAQGEKTPAQTAMAEVLARAAATRNVTLDVVAGRNYAFTITETLADYARLSDLVVIGTQGPLTFPHKQLAERILFDAGRPILLVPGDAGFTGGTIVVAWDASRAATRALHDAMPLLRKAVRVLVTTIRDSAENHAGQSGVELCRRLAQRGIAAEFAGIARQGRPVGACIAALCAEQGADILVMGAQRHARLRDLVYGSVSHMIFDSGPPLPVLMAN